MKQKKERVMKQKRIQSTARQSTVTPRTLNFDDETGPSSPICSTQEEGPKEQFKDDELLADILLNRTSVDDFWKNQEDWEIVRWRLNESSGVHTLELEDGTMIHMLAEKRYPLSRELMIRMLDHGMEVEDESEIAIMLASK
ncbi:hypothetical protein Tco_1358912 [Tanacetum coccineum]